jgi:nicotinate-nucleotide pyrophosphorylase (carboxylating)
MDDKYISNLIENALSEDIGDGDHTSLACIPATAVGKAKLLVKEPGIIAGIKIVTKVFEKIDPEVRFEMFISDGDPIKPGDVAFVVHGKVLTILQAERTVLNILQRMSGIATATHRYTVQLKGLNTKILDTRKTTPGLRLLEKEAVRLGGGVNHRIGLYDMILIKDNHIDFAGGIENAISRANEYLKKTNKKLNIEIEARSLEDVKKILTIGKINRIMLDNFSLKDTRKAVDLIGGKYETESSGGITIDNIRDYAECGVDYISVGVLTHHIKSLDLSLKAIDF